MGDAIGHAHAAANALAHAIADGATADADLYADSIYNPNTESNPLADEHADSRSGQPISIANVDAIRGAQPHADSDADSDADSGADQHAGVNAPHAHGDADS